MTYLYIHVRGSKDIHVNMNQILTSAGPCHYFYRIYTFGTCGQRENLSFLFIICLYIFLSDKHIQIKSLFILNK